MTYVILADTKYDRRLQLLWKSRGKTSTIFIGDLGHKYNDYMQDLLIYMVNSALIIYYALVWYDLKLASKFIVKTIQSFF